MSLKNRTEPKDEHAHLLKLLYLLSTIGFTVVLAITGAFLFGLWLMKRFDLGYAPVLVCLVIGIGFSFYWVYRKCIEAVNLEPPSKALPPQT